MVAPERIASVAPGEFVPLADQRVVLHGVTWAQYEAMDAARGEKSNPRLSYLDGVLEIMTPSRQHERITSVIARLIEVFCLERGREFTPLGSWTLKQVPKEAGAEADECYLFEDQDRDVPDLAIEVIWTSGGIDKLEIYRRLGVSEVWFWKDGAIQIHVLVGDAYARRDQSQCLPGIDLIQLCSFLDHPTASQAIRAYRDALRA